MSRVFLILFLSLAVTCVLSEADHHHGKKKKHYSSSSSSSAVIVGTVYCDTCFQDDFSQSSHFISGASVAVECVDERSSDQSFRQEVETDNHGRFSVKLPFSVSKHVKKIERCSVKLVKSSEPYCAVASSATSSSIRLKSRKPGTHIFSAGFFTFKPENQPEICSRKPATGLKYTKSGLTDPSLPDPVIPDPTPVPGLPGIPGVPGIPGLPGIPSLLPPLPSLPVPPLPNVPGIPPAKKPVASFAENKPEVKPAFFLPPNPLLPPPSIFPPLPFQPSPPPLIPPVPSIPNLPPIPNIPLIPGLNPPSPPPPTLPVPLPPIPFLPSPLFPGPGVPPAGPSKKSSP